MSRITAAIRRLSDWIKRKGDEWAAESARMRERTERERARMQAILDGTVYEFTPQPHISAFELALVLRSIATQAPSNRPFLHYLVMPLGTSIDPRIAHHFSPIGLYRDLRGRLP